MGEKLYCEVRNCWSLRAGESALCSFHGSLPNRDELVGDGYLCSTCGARRPAERHLASCPTYDG